MQSGVEDLDHSALPVCPACEGISGEQRSKRPVKAACVRLAVFCQRLRRLLPACLPARAPNLRKYRKLICIADKMETSRMFVMPTGERVGLLEN